MHQLRQMYLKLNALWEEKSTKNVWNLAWWQRHQSLYIGTETLTLNPKPYILNPKLEFLNPKAKTLNPIGVKLKPKPKPSTLYYIQRIRTVVEK